jgi:hypothetical protein
MKQKLGALIVAGLVLGGGAVALAQADGAPPQAPGAEEGRAERQGQLRKCREEAAQDEEARRRCLEGHRRHGPGMHLARRAVHGDLVVRGEEGSFEKRTFDRGTVDGATTDQRIVLVRPDGPTVSFELTGDTDYHGIDGAGAIREGEPAVVVSDGGKALRVGQRQAGGGPGPEPGPEGGRPPRDGNN